MKPWPQIRAGLLALVIFFGLVEGCPLPPRGKEAAWQKGFVPQVREVQEVVLTPVLWIRMAMRISQRWALYQAPGTSRYRLWIEGQDREGRWQLLFRASDPEHTEDAELIDYTRPRGAWAPAGFIPGQYEPFAAWMTNRVLERHPDFIAARVRLEKVTLTQSGFTPSGEFVSPHVRQRTFYVPAMKQRVQRGAP